MPDDCRSGVETDHRPGGDWCRTATTATTAVGSASRATHSTECYTIEANVEASSETSRTPATEKSKVASCVGPRYDDCRSTVATGLHAAKQECSNTLCSCVKQYTHCDFMSLSVCSSHDIDASFVIHSGNYTIKLKHLCFIPSIFTVDFFFEPCRSVYGQVLPKTENASGIIKGRKIPVLSTSYNPILITAFHKLDFTAIIQQRVTEGLARYDLSSKDNCKTTVIPAHGKAITVLHT